MKNIWDKKCWVVKYSLLRQQLYCKCEGREKENDFFQSPFLYSPRNERTLARSFYLGLVCFLNAFPLSPLPHEIRTTKAAGKDPPKRSSTLPLNIFHLDRCCSPSPTTTAIKEVQLKKNFCRITQGISRHLQIFSSRLLSLMFESSSSSSSADLVIYLYIIIFTWASGLMLWFSSTCAVCTYNTIHNPNHLCPVQTKSVQHSPLYIPSEDEEEYIKWVLCDVNASA